MRIDTFTLDIDSNRFMVHFDSGDFLITLDTIAEVTQIPSLPQHTEPLPLIDYMTIMGVRCMQLNYGINASSKFCNLPCVGR